MFTGVKNKILAWWSSLSIGQRFAGFLTKVRGWSWRTIGIGICTFGLISIGLLLIISLSSVWFGSGEPEAKVTNTSKVTLKATKDNLGNPEVHGSIYLDAGEVVALLVNPNEGLVYWPHVATRPGGTSVSVNPELVPLFDERAYVCVIPPGEKECVYGLAGRESWYEAAVSGWHNLSFGWKDNPTAMLSGKGLKYQDPKKFRPRKVTVHVEKKTNSEIPDDAIHVRDLREPENWIAVKEAFASVPKIVVETLPQPPEPVQVVVKAVKVAKEKAANQQARDEKLKEIEEYNKMFKEGFRSLFSSFSAGSRRTNFGQPMVGQEPVDNKTGGALNYPLSQND